MQTLMVMVKQFVLKQLKATFVKESSKHHA